MIKLILLSVNSSLNISTSEKKSIISNLKGKGYYFAKVETYTELQDTIL